MSKKPIPKPNWAKNSYFWIAIVLFLVAVVGTIRGDATIRDPGQKHEDGLNYMYFGAAILMGLNGGFSHRATLRAYAEQQESN